MLLRSGDGGQGEVGGSNLASSGKWHTLAWTQRETLDSSNTGWTDHARQGVRAGCLVSGIGLRGIYVIG